MITGFLRAGVWTLAFVVPAAALAADEPAKSDFDLAKSKHAAISIASTPDRQPAAAMPRRPAPKGMTGNVTGEMQYIEGPSWNYQSGKRGPKFEVAALGGGMENAPFLAHVGVDWRF